ncbi:PKD domain-containing protein [Engelhardtia mirabilis]|uniref:PKD domain protein n=1 Tax=Engelhardtia mirabilis TaxID=2528011 RepID=A0A518BMS2_9BACT|nr:PKD domain protein [Planctomycetes bacterium Pla133]QDV02607.1 PKD domain protein [Planctomycetes bacterium Pla86]
MSKTSQLACRFASVALLLVTCACSTARMSIRIEPPGVGMADVTVDSKRAKQLEQGEYEARVSVGKDEVRTVAVVAKSEQGVREEVTAEVSKDGVNRVTITMPARVEIRVESGSVRDLIVDGQPVRDLKLPYAANVPVSASGREVVVEATGASGLRTRESVRLVPGQSENIGLELELAARLKTDRRDLSFGDEVVFDASESSPKGAIKEYEWSFGDGTPPQRTTEAIVRHTYDYKREFADPQSFGVTLRVVADDGSTSQTNDTLEAVLHREPLQVAVETYPAARELLRVQAPIQFRLVPKAGFHPRDVRDVVLSFGDGTSTATDPAQEGVTIDFDGDQPRSILVEHTYQAPGRYELELSYGHATLGLEGPYQAQLETPGSKRSTELAVTILPRYLSTEELRGLAWQDAYSKLRGVLDQIEPENASEPGQLRIALTSLEQANYESDLAFKAVLERLTELMVADGRNVLERSSAVMARLAPESVIDISRRTSEGVTAKRDYQPHLEYGLVTGGGERGQPLEYGIRIEGTDDRLVHQQVADTAAGESTRQQEASLRTGGDRGGANLKRTSEDLEATVREAALTMARRDLPVLVARFETADVLVAVRAQEPPEEWIPEFRFSDALGESLAQERVRVELDVRLLDRGGRILDVRQIEGQASQLMPQRLAAQP